MTSQLAPAVGLAEAAKLTGKSVSTIRRKKSELQSLGAHIAQEGWTIPIPALVQLGLLDKVTPPAGGMPPSMTPPVIGGGTSPEIDELRLRLVAVEQRAILAEAIAEERLHRIEDLRQSLHMIEATKPATVSDEKKPHHWWQRR